MLAGWLALRPALSGVVLELNPILLFVAGLLLLQAFNKTCFCFPLNDAMFSYVL